ncbi:type II toxin-antitoxin system HicB family antitoxin [Methanoplanus endosymbiosus]|uniref:Type II toxin-antitoxin system HicB family antitoxin n=1 Tax=Methanoplanus endosymbiosus TaxID=33865 RepID=A0A9E7TL33_9EURY|nr:type II toxin-antitoxin system HicB family antitoxin [Methanoplanus endosymbiosus]UUX93389.1 type II toxin-antitoxin system HicB family antitoxin [Methanoplanus endosymbiosus]
MSGDQKKTHRFTVIIERDEDGIYIAEVPQLRGCHTQAKDLNTLIDRIREAVKLCIDEDDAISPLEFIGLQQIEITV